jgi:uncharacterized protein with PhoU and TrkA domain
MSEQEVQDLLLELKEKAELMVDLAYSSVMFDSRKMAKEVYELENYVDNLNDELRRLAIADAVAGELDASEVLAFLQLGSFAEAIADAARYIADVELRDVELHPVVFESMQESEEVLFRVRVRKDAAFVSKTLGDLRLAAETGMWVIAIKRDTRWLYDPDKRTAIQADDVLFVRGPREGRAHFVALAHAEEKDI